MYALHAEMGLFNLVYRLVSTMSSSSIASCNCKYGFYCTLLISSFLLTQVNGFSSPMKYLATLSNNVNEDNVWAPERTANTNRKRVSVLLCPAQFCVPADYQELITNIQSHFTDSQSVEIGTCKVASLPRTEWIKVARSLPTKEYLDGTLVTRKTVSL